MSARARTERTGGGAGTARASGRGDVCRGAFAGRASQRRCAPPALLAAGLALAATLPAGAAAQFPSEPPAPGEPRAFRLPEIERYTLENGLEVSLVPYGRTPKTLVRLYLPTGNVDETADEVWLADLAADLVREGTTSRTAEEIATEASSMGGSLSVGVGSDLTNAGGDVLEEFAPDMIRLVADVVRNPAFPADELDRLKADRIRQLSVATQQPGTLTQAEFLRRLYPDHPYGRPLPTPATLQGFTVDQIRAFWSEHYQPTGARLYVSGRFDEEAVRQAIQESFGDWPAGDPVQRTPAEAAAGARIVFISRPGAPQSTLQLGLPVVDPSHEDYVALQVTNALLGGSFASRITSNIREDKGYTYSPASVVSSRWRSAYWAEMADVTSDVTGAALREIFHEIDRLRTEAPPEEELEGIKNYMAGLFVLQNSNRAGIVGQLAFLDLHGLPEAYLSDYVGRVHAVSPEEVRRIANEYFRPDDMLLVVTGDPAVALPQLRELGTVEEVGPGAP